MAGDHQHPNYMAIFYWLAILTVGEIAVVFLPHYTGISKLTVGVFLCAFAIVKAAMVAMYFMHLKFEPRKLVYAILVPFPLALILVMFVMRERFK